MIPRINITKEELMHYLRHDDNSIMGTYGKVLPYDEFNLIKIYYKTIFEVYYNLDSELLDQEIKINKEVELMTDSGFTKRNKLLLNYLHKIGLVTSIVFYDDFLIGVILKNYKDYCTVSSIYNQLSNFEQKIVLERMRTSLLDLMNHNIYPSDFKENNILIRQSDLDIKPIDLDDVMTRYESKNYVKEHPYIRQVCLDSYNSMCHRLIRNSQY